MLMATLNAEMYCLLLIFLLKFSFHHCIYFYAITFFAEVHCWLM